MRSQIVFDLDDTLIPSSDAYKEAYETLFTAREMILLDQARKIVHTQLAVGYPSRHHRLVYFKHLLELKKNFSPKHLLKLTTAYENQLLSYLKRWDGLRRQQKTLRQLKQNFDLIILTNETLRTQLLKTSALDPRGEFFNVILTSEEVGKEKPHPLVFSRLKEKLQKKDFKNTFFVGDSWTNDLQPALKNHFKKVFITRQFIKNEAIPLSQIKRISQIQSLEELIP